MRRIQLFLKQAGKLRLALLAACVVGAICTISCMKTAKAETPNATDTEITVFETEAPPPVGLEPLSTTEAEEAPTQPEELPMSEPVPSVPESTEEVADGIAAEPDFAYEKLVVSRVVDGDTIIAFNRESSAEYKIRMILVDTPESVADDEYLQKSGKENTIYGQMASDYTKQMLKNGDEIYVTNDSQSLFDKYERRLCYVWTELPTDIEDENEVRNKCYNAKLLSEGYATVLKIDNDKYYDLFCRLEKEAIDDRRGLWADNSYRESLGLTE